MAGARQKRYRIGSNGQVMPIPGINLASNRFNATGDIEANSYPDPGGGDTGLGNGGPPIFVGEGVDEDTTNPPDPGIITPDTPPSPGDEDFDYSKPISVEDGFSPNNPMLGKTGKRNYDKADYFEKTQGNLKPPPAARAPLAPLSRIPANATGWSPNNPWKGVDDARAARWEDVNGNTAPTRSGSALSILGALRGNTDNPASLPSQINSNRSQGYAGIAAKRPDVVNHYAQNGWDKNDLAGIFNNWWGLDRTGDPSKQFKSLNEYANSVGAPVTGGIGDRFINTPPATNATTALNSIKGYGDVSPLEGQYYLPFFNNELGGNERAGQNIVRSIGLNPDIGNPYSNMLANSASEMANSALVRRAMSGEGVDERGIASDIAQNLANGSKGHLSQQELRSQLSTLRGRDDITPSQSMILDLLQNDPNFLNGILEQSVPRDLRSSFRKSQQNRMNQFYNQAPNMPQKGLADWLLQ